MTEHNIQLALNGKSRKVVVKPNDLLLNVLRENFGFTGTKYGCGIGECGACTVLIDGKPVLSCLILAVTVDGREITTIEGLGEGGLDPVQEAFLEHSAVQCGFCSPGMILAAKSLVNENPAPSEEEIRDYLRGNLCRCTGYNSIVQAVKAVAGKGSGR